MKDILSYNLIFDNDFKIKFDGQQSRKLTEAAILNIDRLSFEESLEYDFYYDGNKISAKIADPNFYELIDKGEAFAKGDTLEVEHQINQKFDETVNTYINKSYQVNKIFRHFSRNEQQKINFKEDPNPN